MTSYPSELPLESVRVLINFLRKESGPAESVHAAWQVLGYGLGKALPVENVFGEHGPEHDIMELQSLLSESDAPQGIFLSIAIGVAIKVAMKIIADYLG